MTCVGSQRHSKKEACYKVAQSVGRHDFHIFAYLSSIFIVFTTNRTQIYLGELMI
jgi:hypothetical protein